MPNQTVKNVNRVAYVKIKPVEWRPGHLPYLPYHKYATDCTHEKMNSLLPYKNNDSVYMLLLHIHLRLNRFSIIQLVDFLVVSETEESAMALRLPTGCLNP